ncbi:MAG: tryptophan-rich sensory protein [Candidatus Taylorbacteria bacterium]|nr:tryptophan-rich sensory protein [Candidatus Taylorbacteria bacterium]
MKKILNKVFVPVAFVIMLLVNYLATALPLGGRSTGEISDNYPNFFTPAGYAFAIWGLIYTLLLIYVVYQFSRADSKLVTQVNRIFLVNALLNALWLFAWHYNIVWLSLVLMIGLLVTLIKIADILRQSALTQKERIIIRLPFSIYFGWITVATIANVTIFLLSLGWNGFGIAESIWTVIVLLVGAIIGSWRTISDRNIPYALVLIWAYGAILSKHLSEGASGFASAHPTIIATVVLCLVVFVGSMVYVVWKGRGKKISAVNPTN